MTTSVAELSRRGRRGRSVRTEVVAAEAARAADMLACAAKWARQGLVIDAEVKRRLVSIMIRGRD